MTTHLQNQRQVWESLAKVTKDGGNVILDGEEGSLSLGHVVAVSRYGTQTSIAESERLIQRTNASIETLHRHLAEGENIYGVNTGCGGNADTRTQRREVLQHSFFQHHQCGVLPELASSNSFCNGINGNNNALNHDVSRGTILLRCSSLLHGHSAVRLEVIKLMIDALNLDIIPLIPRRGSISASGDLSPLSYVGGLIEGNPDIFVRTKPGQTATMIMSAEEALKRASLTPFKMQAKEGLGVMNGTAPSTAASALALYDTHNLAILVQLLTAMATEALLGTVDDYHEFISKCRPHPGQSEVAKNMRTFLAGSKLCHGMDTKSAGLVQDRYPLRTAPQWIGPLLEDLVTANQQVHIELNSTTDNPLIDSEGDRFHQGGNFQAASVTSAMEKTRTVLTMLGRLLASQCSEIVNPLMNKGLSPNLCFDDPSISFASKGLDVNMTAYYSELAFLANSVASHVQSAEMNNQSVNSLALIASRYTAESVEIVSIMCAAHLYVLCQALDLRALHRGFLIAAEERCSKEYKHLFHDHVPSEFDQVWGKVADSWAKTSNLDLTDRCDQVAADSIGDIFNTIADSQESPSQELSDNLQGWKVQLARALSEVFHETRRRFLEHQFTPDYLADSTREVYLFVRKQLKVPLHQGLGDHPTLAGNEDEASRRTSIGSYITRIYVAIRDGQIVELIKTATSQDV